MTVGELKARISSAEVTEWLAVWRLEEEEREKAELAAKAEQQLGSFKAKMAKLRGR